MPRTQPSLFARPDTLFGVCEALGEDFGFNPIFLRLPLGVLLLWNPTIIVSAYLSAGLLVMVSRSLAPNPRLATSRRHAPASEAATVQPSAEHRLLKGDCTADADVLSVAA